MRCEDCAAGTFSAKGSVAIGVCTSCGEGTARSFNGSSITNDQDVATCIPCGKYAFALAVLCVETKVCRDQPLFEWHGRSNLR